MVGVTPTIARLLIPLALLGPPEGEGPNDGAPVVEPADYEGALALLRRGLELVDADPNAALVLLDQALADLNEFAPQLAADADALALRARAELAVAALHQQAAREVGSAQISDDLPPTLPSAPSDVGQPAMTAGKATMITGGGLMLVGVALFFGGVFGTNDFNDSLSIVGAGAILGIIGAPTLIAGGISYGVGKRLARRAGQARLLTPTLLVGRSGAQLGVAFEF
jgi:hypothetical protein